ncbi:MAG TPA: hypothetical protein VFD91_10790 [Mariniphaga sp.]|nr:hypothetical protein [Mariniphaga sp.]
MLQRILILAGYIVLGAFLAVSLSFVVSESRNVNCKDIHIELSEDDVIRISRNEIRNLINDADKQIIGKQLRHINTDHIEQEIETHRAIEKAEVFKILAADSSSYKGIIGVRVKHREPVVRIVSGNGKYYLDKWGEKIPVSSVYTARVLVVTGNFSEEYAKRELLPFVIFLNENPFWEAQIEQVHVDSLGEVFLTPLVGDQTIEFGSLKNYQVKMRNLKAFYEQVMAQNNWDNYKEINLKYRNQVIAKKR